MEHAKPTVPREFRGVARRGQARLWRGTRRLAEKRGLASATFIRSFCDVRLILKLFLVTGSKLVVAQTSASSNPYRRAPVTFLYTGVLAKCSF